MNKIDELKDLCAAYQAAVNYDYCPSPDEAVKLTEEIHTVFEEDNFRRGAKKNEGKRPDEIAQSIISFVGWQL